MPKLEDALDKAGVEVAVVWLLGACSILPNKHRQLFKLWVSQERRSRELRKIKMAGWQIWRQMGN